jgi:hypothetical protein
MACGVLSIASKFVEKKLSTKVRKHDDLRMLALSKATTIALHVSTTLRDGMVSDEEFRMIMEELAKNEELKASIRVAGRHAHSAVRIDDEAKKALIQRGREEARASMIASLTAKPSAPASQH